MPEWLVPAGMLIVGLVLLATAADRFVVAAARLSKLWGVSPILIGALVVGMGTSSPELLVSVLAALGGEVDLAVGNAVGSNVANVTLVLGATAVLTPLAGNLRVLRREGILMFVAVSAFAATLYDFELTRVEGVGLLGFMVVAAYLVVRWARADQADGLAMSDPDVDDATDISWPREVGMGLFSLALTLTGAELLVTGGVDLASQMGVDSAFVGLTLVAVGTSLPELATSIAGVRRGEHDMVIGNVVGSNLFNALAVAGVAGSLSPGSIDDSFRLASMVMVGCAALAGILAFTGRELVRWEGALLLCGFGGFVYLSYIG
ncbi:MAG: calcium/sodium antiporter [Myxococcota bacterium]